MYKSLFFLFFLFFCCCLYTVHAQVKLPRLISNGMVLQQHTPLHIWGWAAPQEKITIRFSGKSYPTRADENGNWRTVLPAQEAGGPFQLIISASNQIVLDDILIGEVWLCSGQSNMELTMDRVKYRYPQEMTGPGYAAIRQFTVPDKYDFISEHQDLDGGDWLKATHGNLPQFSAVAWFFAKQLYEKYKVPIGLINAALGGSPAEAWISEASLKQFPAYYQELQKFKDRSLIISIETHDRNVSGQWFKELNAKDEGLAGRWAAPGLEDASWKKIKVPGYWATAEPGFVNGVAWYRTRFELPASATAKPARLELGRLIDADSAFINGQFAGTTGYQYPPRRYILPGGILKAGTNSLVVRIVSQSGRGGFVPDKPYRFITGNDTFRLDGEWKFRPGASMEPLPAQTFIRWKPGGLYNAMIAPLTNTAIKGVIWYQGESNAGRPGDYHALMQTLVANWRAVWKIPALPFIYTQLPNYMEAVTTPAESNWAALRQQQLNLLATPHTAMAVAIDAGEWNDIHPENKKTIGDRLALQARRIAYGEKKLVACGPIYQSMKINGRTITLHFSNTGSGLVAKGDTALSQFAVAGADGKYVWAKALIKGNTVQVWNDAIAHPVSVRYAWADNPEGANLYNREGLPAAPFEAGK